MGEKFEMELVAKNNTGKGWADAEAEAKRRAKKIASDTAKYGAGGAAGGGGGGLSTLIHGMKAGGGGVGGIAEGIGLGKLAGIGAAVAGITALGFAIKDVISKGMEFAGALTVVKENTGASMDSIKGLDLAAVKYGLTMDNVQNLLQKSQLAQSKALGEDSTGETRKAFEALGISMDQLKSMDPDQLLEAIAKGFRDTGNYAAVFATLGKQTSNVTGLLKELGERGMRGLADDANYAAEANVRAVHKMETTWERWGKKFTGMKTDWTGKFARMFFGSGEDLQQQTNDQEFADNEKATNEKKAARQKAIDTIDPKTKQALKAAGFTDEKLHGLTDEKLKEVSGMAEEIAAKKKEIEEPGVGLKHQAEEQQKDINRKQDEVAVAREALDKRAHHFTGANDKLARQITGLSEKTVEEQAADDIRRINSPAYDRQQKRMERDAKHTEHRLNMREKMLANKDLHGPWVDRARAAVAKARNAFEKRQHVEDYEEVIAKASRESRNFLEKIKDATEYLKKLEDDMKLKGGQ